MRRHCRGGPCRRPGRFRSAVRPLSNSHRQLPLSGRGRLGYRERSGARFVLESPIKPLARTEPDLQLAPWLYRIATNTALDALRRRKRITWVPFLEEYEPPAVGGDPGTTVPNQDAVHRALQAVAMIIA